MMGRQSSLGIKTAITSLSPKALQTTAQTAASTHLLFVLFFSLLHVLLICMDILIACHMITNKQTTNVNIVTSTKICSRKGFQFLLVLPVLLIERAWRGHQRCESGRYPRCCHHQRPWAPASRQRKVLLVGKESPDASLSVGSAQPEYDGLFDYLSAERWANFNSAQCSNVQLRLTIGTSCETCSGAKKLCAQSWSCAQCSVG